MRVARVLPGLIIHLTLKIKEAVCIARGCTAQLVEPCGHSMTELAGRQRPQDCAMEHPSRSTLMAGLTYLLVRWDFAGMQSPGGSLGVLLQQ